MQAAGVGAGATLLPTAEVAAAADLPLVGGPEFPIGIFWPPHPFATSLERYQEIADAGFTFVVTGNYLFDSAVIGHAMGFAEQVGLKVLVSSGDPAVGTPTHTFTIGDDASQPLTLSEAEARTLFERALAPYLPHASFAGLSLYDEPAADRFDTLRRAVAIVRELAPDKLPYINLFPSTDPAYPADFANVVAPSLISYDRYPLLTSSDDAGYFRNFVNVRDVALQHGIPAWIYIQTLGYTNHRTPTATELRWQVNMALAYGYKGIQYFTYWTPDPARGEGFQPALITVDGHRTERYAAAQEINVGWLAPVGRELKPLTSEAVVHANESPLPDGAVGFAPDDWVSAVSGGAVLGRFVGADAATRWLLVANRSHSARQPWWSVRIPPPSPRWRGSVRRRVTMCRSPIQRTSSCGWPPAARPCCA